MDTHLERATNKVSSGTFQPIIEAVSRTTNLPACIWVLDEPSQALKIAASVGLPSSYVREACLSLSEPSVTGEVFKSGNIMMVHDILADARWKYKDVAREMGWKSALCVPIEVRDAVIGVLSIYTFVIREFSDMEKQLLTDYATQIELTFEADRGRRTLGRLLEVGQSIEQLLTSRPKAVFEEIVKGACEVIEADCAVLYPYDPRREDFYDVDSVVAYGLDRELKLSERPRRQKGMAAFVRREGEVIRSNIEIDDPGMLTSPFIKREGIKAFMGIALKVAEDVLGILYIDFRAPHQFTEDEKDTIRLFAHQASIAISNSGLYQQAETRAQVLTKLYEISPTLVSIGGAPGSLQTILTQIVQGAQNVLGADLVDLYQYIQNKNEYILPPVEVGERYDPSVRKDKIHEDDVVCAIVKSGHPQYAVEAQQDATLIQPFIARPDAPLARFVIRENIKSSAAVPLIVGAEVVGVLFANYRSPQTFPQQQRELIELFASQAAIAIRNVRLFQQRKALQDIARDITRILDKDELLQRILARSLELLGCEIGSIALLNKSTNQLEFQYAEKEEENYPSSLPVGHGLSGTAAATGQPVRVGDVTQDSRYIQHSAATRSEMDVPMRIGEELIGVLNFESMRYNAFDQDSEELAVILAGQAAVALYNATLFDQRQALQEIALSITSILDVDKLLSEILKRSRELLHCPIVSIALWNKTTNTLEYRFAIGEQEGLSLPLDRGLGGVAAKTRRPARVGDVTKAPGYFEHLTETRSELDVPLLVGNELIGILNAESSQYDAFSEEDEKLAITFASQVAVAVYNAELYQRTQKQLEQRQTLNEVSKLLIEKRYIDETIGLLVQKTINLFNVDQGSFWFVDYAHNRVNMRFSIGQNGKTTDWQEKAQASVPLDANSSIVGHTAVRGTPDLWNDPSKCPYWNSAFDKKTGYKTKRILSVPLLLAVESFQEEKPIVSLEGADRVRPQKAIGVLQLLNPVDDSDFTEEDKEFLMSIAAMAAVALHNAEMHEREIALSEIGRALTGGIRLREAEVLELMREQAGRVMDTDNMFIALYDEPTDTVRFGLAFVNGERIDVATEERWQSRKAGKGRTEEIIHTREPIFNATRAEGEAWYAQQGHKEYTGKPVWASWLGVPMMVGEKVLGVIATYHPERDNVYSENDLMVLQAMANQAAIALDNSHMFYDVNRRLEALVSFGQAVTSGIRLREDEVLELIYSQAHQLMDTSNMYIALYDEPTDTVRFGLAFVNGERIDVATEERWQSRKAGKGRTEEIIHTREPIFNATRVEGEAWYAQQGHKEYVGSVWASWLGVPMMVGEKVLGVIATYHPTRDYVYSGDDLTVLQAMAEQAAIALDNTRLYESTRRLQDEVVAGKQVATLGTAMAALQHRINNTFNIIVPNVTRLRHRVDARDKTIVEILDMIERNARYTSEIIARVQHPLQEMESGSVDINAILNDVVSAVKEQWQADVSHPPIEIALELDDAVPIVQAPVGQITEVFRNLVDNAFRAMKQGGHLKVSSSLSGNTIWVRVQDTGPGIPPQIQQRLFAKPVPSRDPGGGAGLGLWLSQLILQTIGGDVKIEHTSPIGTTMLVRIPASGTGKEA